MSLRIHAKVFSTFFRQLAQDSHPTLVMMRTKLAPKQTLPETVEGAIAMAIGLHAVTHDCHGYVVSRDDLGNDFAIVSEIIDDASLDALREHALAFCDASMISIASMPIIDAEDLYDTIATVQDNFPDRVVGLGKRTHKITWDDELDICADKVRETTNTGANGTVNIRKGR